MTVITAREEGTPSEELSEDTSNGPDVDCLGVHLERQHDLGCTVPTGSHIFRHDANLLACGDAGLDASGQSEVANLEIAVGIEKQVGGFQVAMDNVGAVNRFEGAQSLVNEILTVIIRQVLSPDNTVKISLHQLLDEVDFFELIQSGRLDDVQNRDDLTRW
jgi:hypothetical protein